MRKTCGQPFAQTTGNMWATTSVSPQVVFTSSDLGINTLFAHTLCKFYTHTSTQAFGLFNRLCVYFYPLSTGLIVVTTKEN